MLFFGHHLTPHPSRASGRLSPRTGATLLWFIYVLAIALHGGHYMVEARKASLLADAAQRTRVVAFQAVVRQADAPAGADADDESTCPECQALLLLGAMLLFATRAPKMALALPRFAPVLTAAPARIPRRHYRRHAARAPPHKD